MLANTRPFLSAIASIVTQTTFVSGSSTQIVEEVIEENSFVNVTLINVNNVNNFVDCQHESTQCRSRCINPPYPPKGGRWNLVAA
jgi:hypothetical protein